MRMTQQQLRTLRRYPRSASVWRRHGIRLTPRTRVVVSDNGVCIVRPQNASQ